MAKPVNVSVFGSLLRRHRLAAGLTQAALAERAGLAERTVQDLERGVARPLRETVRRLVAALDPTPEACVQFEAAISAPRRHAGPTTRPRRRGEPPVAPDGGIEVPATVSRDARSHNLPRQATPLLGRNQEVRAVCSLLLRDGVQLVTLTGPPGSGKTRLGIQVAADLLDRFEDGAYFVDLAPISDPGLVVSTIAQVLGVQHGVGRPLLDDIVDSLRGRRLVLVLDNFEQILAAAAVADTLVRACPRLSILVTSRAPLQVRSEHEYPVPPLALPDSRRSFTPEALARYGAVALFVERATAIKPDFVLNNANAPVVAEVCARLDGLPLAIELAAARIRLLSPEAILPRLAHGLTLLTGGRRDLPPRQQTLRGAIAWSYDLLPAAKQRLFRRLSVFIGGATLDAAEAVCHDDPKSRAEPALSVAKGQAARVDLLDAIASLVDSNLMRSEELLVGEPRFWMLETIREYGLEQLGAAGEEATVRRRHLGWCADLAERCQSGIFGPDGPDLLDRLAAELDNFRSALTWSLTDPTFRSARTGLRLASALHELWFFRDHMAEGQHWLEQTLAADDARGEPIDQPRPLLANRAGLFGAHPRVNALNAIGDLRLQQNMANDATIPSAEALALARTVGDRVGEAHALIQLGMSARMLGDVDRARTLHDEALSLARSLDDKLVAWRSLITVGRTLAMLRDYDGAWWHLEECLAMARSMGHVWGTANSLRMLGRLALQEGKLDRAAALIEESLPFLSRMGDLRTTRQLLWDLGWIALADKDPRRAGARFCESLKLSLEASVRREIPRCVDGLVAASMQMASSAPRSTRAAWLLGASATMRETYGGAIHGDEQPLLDQAVAAIRSILGEEAYDVAQAEGRSLSFGRAIELTLALAAEIQTADL
jgi:predicted ATPase/transcriptional regulator with XRE-family HTH domain